MKKKLVMLLLSCAMLTACGKDEKIAMPSPEDMDIETDVDDDRAIVEDDPLLEDVDGTETEDVDDTTTDVQQPAADDLAGFSQGRVNPTFFAFVNEIQPTGYLTYLAMTAEESESSVNLLNVSSEVPERELSAYDYITAATLLPFVTESGELYASLPADENETIQYIGFKDEESMFMELMSTTFNLDHNGESHLIDTDEYAPDWSSFSGGQFKAEGDCQLVFGTEDEDFFYGFNEEFQSRLEVPHSMTTLVDSGDHHWWIVIPNTSMRFGSYVSGNDDETAVSYQCDVNVLAGELTGVTPGVVNLHELPVWAYPDVKGYAIEEDFLCSMTQEDFDAFVTTYLNTESSFTALSTQETVVPEFDMTAVTPIMEKYVGYVPTVQEIFTSDASVLEDPNEPVDEDFSFDGVDEGSAVDEDENSTAAFSEE